MKLNAKYGLLQATYWMLYCIGYGYVTYYLQAYGFEVGEIGVLTAVFGVIAALTQTRLGNVADRSAHWNWKSLLTLLSLVCAGIVVAMGVVPGKWPTGVLFGAFLVTIASMMPMVNSASFAYQDEGQAIDFGKARGLGSLAYAAISYVLGALTARMGTLPVVVAGLVDCLAIFAITRSLPDTKKVAKAVSSARSGGSNQGFVSKYPAFVMMLVGLVLLLSFHNGINTYMLQIMQNVGGDSATMGTAMSIAAICELPIMFGFAQISKRVSVEKLLLLCGVAYVARAVMLLFAGNVMTVYVQQVLQMLSFAMYASAAVYYTDEVMQAEDKVTGQALMSGVATFGAVIGNLCCGWVLQLAGIRAMFVALLVITVAGMAGVALANMRGRRSA